VAPPSIENPLRDLFARVLATAPQDAMSALLAEAMKNALANFDVREVMKQALEPVISRLVREMIEEPTIKAAFETRLRQQLTNVINNLTLTPSTRY
jgi:C4-dicarboxylate-specific signal transduction histidine kinase